MADEASPADAEPDVVKSVTLDEIKKSWSETESTSKEIHNFEDVLRVIKPLGHWQLRNFFIIFLTGLFFGILLFYTSFWILITPEFACNDGNFTSTNINNPSIDRCLRSDGNKCSNFTFFTEYTLHSTAMTEFGMVCDRAYGFQFTLNAFYIGIAVACTLAAVIGYTDRFGRKRVLVFGLVMTGLSYGLGGLSPSFNVLLASRFVMPIIGSELVWAAMQPLGLEMTVAKYRPYIGVIPAVGWNCGSVVSCAIAWFVRDWRPLQSYSAVPMLVMAAIVYLLVPESPRWLLVNGYTQQAETVLRNAAALNGVKLKADIDFAKIATTISNEEKQQTARDFRLWKRLCNKVLLTRLGMDVYWTMTCSFVWWGLSWSSPRLPVNIFLLNAIMNFGAVLGSVAAAVFMSFIPRKPSFCVTILSAGGVLLALPWLPKDYGILVIALAFLGKVLSGAAWNTATVYAAEFFPTTMRGTLPHVGSSGGDLIGAAVSGAVSDIITYWPHLKWLPSVLMAASTVPAALLMLIPPETMGRRLPDHLTDVSVQDQAHHAHAKALRKESSWTE